MDKSTLKEKDPCIWNIYQPVELTNNNNMILDDSPMPPQLQLQWKRRRYRPRNTPSTNRKEQFIHPELWIDSIDIFDRQKIDEESVPDEDENENLSKLNQDENFELTQSKAHLLQPQTAPLNQVSRWKRLDSNQWAQLFQDLIHDHPSGQLIPRLLELLQQCPTLALVETLISTILPSLSPEQYPISDLQLFINALAAFYANQHDYTISQFHQVLARVSEASGRNPHQWTSELVVSLMQNFHHHRLALKKLQAQT